MYQRGVKTSPNSRRQKKKTGKTPYEIPCIEVYPSPSLATDNCAPLSSTRTRSGRQGAGGRVAVTRHIIGAPVQDSGHQQGRGTENLNKIVKNSPIDTLAQVTVGPSSGWRWWRSVALPYMSPGVIQLQRSLGSAPLSRHAGCCTVLYSTVQYTVSPCWARTRLQLQLLPCHQT